MRSIGSVFVQQLCISSCVLLLVTCTMYAQDTTQKAPATALEVPMSKSPTEAVMYSLLLPGWGQYYVQSYWKIPIITGTAAVSGYLFFANNSLYNTASDAYDVEIAANPTSTEASRLLRQREAYRDNRDLAGVVFLVTYAVAAIDAYVGAHLFDFNVNDDLSMGIGTTPTGLLAFQAQVRF